MKSIGWNTILLSIGILLGTACNNANDKAEDAVGVERENNKGITRQDNTDREDGNSVDFEVTDTNGTPSGRIEGDIELE